MGIYQDARDKRRGSFADTGGIYKNADIIRETNKLKMTADDIDAWISDVSGFIEEYNSVYENYSDKYTTSNMLKADRDKISGYISQAETLMEQLEYKRESFENEYVEANLKAAPDGRKNMMPKRRNTRTGSGESEAPRTFPSAKTSHLPN